MHLFLSTALSFLAAASPAVMEDLAPRKEAEVSTPDARPVDKIPQDAGVPEQPLEEAEEPAALEQAAGAADGDVEPAGDEAVVSDDGLIEEAAADSIDLTLLPPVGMPSDQAILVDAVSARLNAIGKLKGRFTQYGADGSVTHGEIAMRRPGRIRFDYEDAPLLIVSDGATVAVRDEELETTDRIPLAQTPLNVLLKPAVDLRRDAVVVSVRQFEEAITLELEDKTGEAEGRLSLSIDPVSYDLREWSVIDAANNVTRIVLSDLREDVELDPRLFILRDDSEDDGFGRDR